MKIPQQAINFCIILPMIAASLLLSGCASSSKEKKPSDKYSTLRLYGAVPPDQTERHQSVQIYRRTPIMMSVAAEPFLDEGYIVEATVVEAVGGFMLRVQYDKHGTGVLEIATHRMRNQHIAIHSSFPETRWLAAPIINAPISNGLLVFTPDATREEADRIAKGLNALAKKLRKK
jgi:uncharacterized protein YceK